MINIEFYFDPACPFSWITSRWLLQVQAERDVDIAWRQFSLALKNDELLEKEEEPRHAKTHRASHRIHRVIRRAVTEHGASVIGLYTEFGRRFHIEGKSFDDEMICEVLTANGLPLELPSTADGPTLDVELAAELGTAIDAAGKDIGVPTIVFPDKAGRRLGYFGPVLNELPSSLEESLDLWDGLAKLARTSSFYEIKRARPGGKPDVSSTAHL